MAVVFDAAADRLLRTSNNPPTSGDWTICFWLYLETTPTTYANYMYVGSDNGDTSDWVLVMSANNTSGLLLDVKGSWDIGTTKNIDQWYHLAVVRDGGGTTTTCYLDGVQDAQVSDVNTGNARWEFGGLGTLDVRPLDGRVANIKRWDGTAMTAAQVLNERRSFRPVELNDLVAWYPTFPGSGERARDYGAGTIGDFTESGTLTDGLGPAISWGAPPLEVALGAHLPNFMHHYQQQRQSQ